MIIITDNQIINFDNVTCIVKDSELKKDKKSLNFYFNNNSNLLVKFKDETAKQYAFLNIIQANSQKLDCCYLSGDIFDYLSKQIILVKDQKKQFKKEVLEAFCSLTNHFKDFKDVDEESINSWIQNFLKKENQNGL